MHLSPGKRKCMMEKIKAGIIGGAGYTGGELIRLLIQSSHVQFLLFTAVAMLASLFHSVHPDLIGETDLSFQMKLINDVDVVFLMCWSW